MLEHEHVTRIRVGWRLDEELSSPSTTTDRG
jgi:hypothetical protein